MGFSDKTESEGTFSADRRETAPPFGFPGAMKILQNFSNFGDHRFLSTISRNSFIFNSIGTDELISNIIFSDINSFDRRTEFIIREFVPTEYPVESLVYDYEPFVPEDTSQFDFSSLGFDGIVFLAYITEITEVVGSTDALRFQIF